MSGLASNSGVVQGLLRLAGQRGCSAAAEVRALPAVLSATQPAIGAAFTSETSSTSYMQPLSQSRPSSAGLPRALTHLAASASTCPSSLVPARTFFSDTASSKPPSKKYNQRKLIG